MRVILSAAAGVALSLTLAAGSAAAVETRVSPQGIARADATATPAKIRRKVRRVARRHDASPAAATQARRVRVAALTGAPPAPRPVPPAGAPAVTKLSGYKKGTIVVDTGGRRLYYALGNGKAYVYPVAVGKQGFTWTGKKKISRVADWPDWRPPAEMRRRKPNLPAFVKGGPANPLGAKALYLGSSLYRIHGTNDPHSIGTAASSGCIRMRNEHVTHLSRLAGVGSTVHVVRKL
ncbi:MAG: L,D-transpeptidase [Hyphomicrobiaceae bacterium]|nr:L,D-transpeptidase [Hyphomicrobiaceae bacterium]